MVTDSYDWSLETDVVVVGYGIAALTAAITAHDAGARVIMFEKMPAGREGGNSRVSGNTWANFTDEQGAAAHLRALCAQNPLPEPIVTAWASEVVRNTDWLESLGARVKVYLSPTEFPYLATSDVYTGFSAMEEGWGGSNQWRFLAEQVAHRDIDVRLGTPVRRLLTDAEGAVIGIVASNDSGEFRVRTARGVVLASGGFEANKQMALDYLGLENTSQVGSPGNTGDGHRMAQAVGADLWHMNNYMPVPAMVVDGAEAAYEILQLTFTGGVVEADEGMVLYGEHSGLRPVERVPLMFIGKDGRRFTNEAASKGHGHGWLHGRMEIFPTRPMWVVVDQTIVDEGPLDGPVELEPWGWNKIINGYRWDPTNRKEIEKGWLRTGESVSELAEAISVDPDALQDTFDAYARSCAEGRDDFGRTKNTLIGFGSGPYYAFYSGPVIYYTNGGPRKNERAQVISSLGEPIEGLYVAGEVSSTYTLAQEAGMMIGDAMAFGRIAGRNAAAGVHS